MPPLEKPIAGTGPAGAGFRSVLVANRGEIACRIIRTLRALGIRSIAVFSDADAGARHVALADSAVRIGPPPARLSYLDGAAILAAAERSGAEAVHPGYGFLSESAEFAGALREAGLVFIGPDVEALRVMGDKIRSKDHVSSHGVPVVPGLAQTGLTEARFLAAAEDLGFPLLIKPSAGGGGKGMHTVLRREDLPAALAAARRVASAAFGNDTLLLERLIPAPRHIEVQVLADNYGNVIHLGERECSLQRRHQKVIEEAPSPLLSEERRARMGAAACSAARSVGYRGAGTVEFLVSDAAPDAFYFMEMNTRLQVEHPVTEMVTGLDLVEWQVRIAAGEALGIRQEDVRLTGHAVEARIYAEDPEGGFLPTAGTVLGLQEPAGPGIRVDSCLLPGLVLGTDYDPMLAKVIAWGADRTQALQRLDLALGGTAVLGLGTNIEYLRLLLQDDDVRTGRLDTTLIERRLPALHFRRVDKALLAAAALAVHGRETGPRPALAPWTDRSGWRPGGGTGAHYEFRTPAEEPVQVRLNAPWAGDGNTVVGAMVSVDGGAPVPAVYRQGNGHGGQVDYDGGVFPVHVAADGPVLWLSSEGFSCRLRLLGRDEQVAAMLAGKTTQPGVEGPDVRSPMPGTVVAVHVADGATVAAGAALLSVEAMKMEHQLPAPVAGRVRVGVRVGDSVKAGQLLAALEPEAAGPDAAAEREAAAAADAAVVEP